MRGLLIEKNSNDGSGHSLIEENYKIINESDESIKKHFGKGCKPLKQEDCLFDIPENWCWERFGNLVINFDSQRKPVTKSERKRLVGHYDYYGATGAIDRVDDFIFDGEYLMIGEDGGNFYVSKDNSFIARGKFWANNHVHVVQPVACDITYLKHCLDAYDLPKMGLVYGIGAPKLNQENMNSIPIPVPPLVEQKRIVEKIEQIFSILDTINKLQAQYADNLTVLKSKLIDLAIQGKLTEQLPEDGTAEELYQQIQEEKQALIKSGKIKKEKPLPEIAEDEVPFEIPDSWKWVRLGSIARVLGGKRIPAGRSLTEEDTGHKYIRVSDMKNHTVQTKGLLFVPRDIYPSIAQYIINKEDIYITVAGTIGRVGKIPPEIDGANLTENADRIVFSYLNQDWFIICLSSSAIQKQIGRLTTSVAQPKLAIKRIQEFLIPLSPLAEQQRIVKYINEFINLYDNLKKSE